MAWQPQAVVPGGFTDEAMLVAALRGGQHEAFEALHESFAAPIYNLALRIVEDREEAKDVAQEVLIKAYRGLPAEAPDLSLTPWLYRVTVNAAFDHVRARGRRPRAVCADEQQPQMAAPVDEFEQSELARRVEQTLRALPKRQQVALLLRDVHGLSVGETADALGLTRGSADVLLSRARSRFRRVFTAGAGAVAGRCTVAADAVAGGVGGGGSSRRRDAVLAHARSCPECRKTVDLWAAAPLGLGVVLPQLAAPAALSTAGTVAAAAATAAGEGAAGAVLGGLLAKLGALAGVKVATVAAVVAVAAGTAGVATYEVKRDAGHPSDPAVAAQTALGHGAAGAPAAGGAGTRDAWALGREGVRLRAAARGRQALRSPDGRARGAHAANGVHTGGGMSGSGASGGMSGSGSGGSSDGGMSGSGASGGMSGSGSGGSDGGMGGSGGDSGSGGGAGG